MDNLKEGCPHCERLLKSRSGELSNQVWETPQVVVIAGDHQYFAGYCVVISKTHVREMHHMDQALAAKIFCDVMAVGRTIEAAFKSHKMNYVSLGNVDEHLHWHVMPRYTDDPDHKDHPWKNTGLFSQKPTTNGHVDNLRKVFSKV